MLKKLIKKRIPDKIVAMILILTMTLVNIAFLATYFLSRADAYATEYAEPVIEKEIIKAVDLGEHILVQYLIKAKYTNEVIEEVPTLHGESPTLIKIYAANEETEVDWEYDDHEGIINITLNSTTNEIYITYIYEKTEELEEYIGYVADTSIKFSKANLSKAHMYNNIDFGGELNETEYAINWETNISFIDEINQITINQISMPDEYITEINELSSLIGGNNTIYYQSTTIAKTNFDKIMGEEGTIEIFDANTNQSLLLIDKDTEPDENGNITIEYEDKTIYILRIEVNNPNTEGMLKITHKKAIKDNLGAFYTKGQMKEFEKLRTSLQTTLNEDAIIEEPVNGEIPFLEPITAATVSIKNPYNNSNTLLTTQLNENVEIVVTLKGNNLKYDLYKNPIIQVELPSYIEDISNINVDLFQAPNLNYVLLEKYSKTGNLITIPLTGQTEYSSSLIEGTQVIIHANLKVNFKTPTDTKNVKAYVYNDKDTQYEMPEVYTLSGHSTVELCETEVNFAAPTGMITYNSISNYDSLGSVVTSLNNDGNARNDRTI